MLGLIEKHGDNYESIACELNIIKSSEFYKKKIDSLLGRTTPASVSASQERLK